MLNLIFIHGYTASSKSDWYPEIVKILNKKQVKFYIPDLPGNLHPHSQEWLKMIDKIIKQIKGPIILVGHSLGTRTVLLYLDQFPKKVTGILLIAPLSNDVKNAQRRNGNAYPDFFEYKIDLEKIKLQCPKIVIMHSLNDDHLNYEEHGEKLASDLNAKLITYTDRLHFSAAENAPIIASVLEQEFKVI